MKEGLDRSISSIERIAETKALVLKTVQEIFEKVARNQKLPDFIIDEVNNKLEKTFTDIALESQPKDATINALAARSVEDVKEILERFRHYEKNNDEIVAEYANTLKVQQL